MTTLVLGASGATGKRLVDQLLLKGQSVKVIVRNSSIIPDGWQGEERLRIIRASISEMSVEQLAMHIQDCDAVASCLGHNLNWKGIYGEPRKLVSDAIQNICNAINSSGADKPTKLILMSTTGYQNKNAQEEISTSEKIVIGILRKLLPPHVDNEKAADFLNYSIGMNSDKIEWTAVRPDNLMEEEEPTEYEIYPSPIRSGIFNPGKTSRINVAHFMARLASEPDLWAKWKGQMPVIYNK